MFLFLFVVLCSANIILGGDNDNERPIIAIPSMAITDELWLKTVPKLEDRFYIGGSYVKLMEMAGARVAPIPSNVTDKQLEYIFNSTNGLLFPGGETNLEDSGYFKMTKKLYDMSVKSNANGNFHPILGICRGMQALIVHTQGDITPLKLTDSRNYTTSLKFTPEAKKSVTFGSLAESSYKDAEEQNITAHFHKYGVNPKDFDDFPKVKEAFKILATSVDRKRVHFVSAMEGIKLPFYGLQYHPEKVIFEWSETVNIPHSYAAVKFSQNIANVFVEQARQNKNKFRNFAEARQYVISKEVPYYTGNLVKAHSPFVQIFVY